MWSAEIDSLNSGRIQKFSLFREEGAIAYSEAIQLWEGDGDFRRFFITLLAKVPFRAYFWETPPVTTASAGQPFEFVVVESPDLAKVRPDDRTFGDYFNSAPPDKAIVSFPSLGKDALLIAPRPLVSPSAYPHLARFVREAPEAQQQELWREVGAHLARRLGENPVWVSTSGLGVYWLHVRLDSRPKYYTFRPYKRSPQSMKNEK